MGTKEELEASYRIHFRMVWNLCYTYLRNPADTEDAVQETFMKLAVSRKRFRDRDHEKAWLIVTAGNVCKDELKRMGRREVPLDMAEPIPAAQPEIDETLQALRALPEKYRTVLYLFYYEGLPTKQIGKLLKKPDVTVRSDLHRGRQMLKARLEGRI